MNKCKFWGVFCIFRCTSFGLQNLKNHLICQHIGGCVVGNIKDPVIRINSLHLQRKIQDTKENFYTWNKFYLLRVGNSKIDLKSGKNCYLGF